MSTGSAGSLGSPKNVEFQKQLSRVKNRVAVLRHKAEVSKGSGTVGVVKMATQNSVNFPQGHDVDVIESKYFRSSGDGKQELTIDTRDDISPAVMEQKALDERDADTDSQKLPSRNLLDDSFDEEPSETHHDSQRCPVCSGPLLRNYNPDDAAHRTPALKPDSTSKTTQENHACSLALPLQELFNSFVIGEKGDDSNSENKNNLTKQDHWYCITCQAYVVKDEDEFKKRIRDKERQIEELERQKREQIKEVEDQFKQEMTELDTQYKQQIERMEIDRSYMQANHSRRITEMESQQQMMNSIREKQEKKIESLFAKVYKGERLRQKLHNHLQELRGNVRVFVRTRPFISQDGEDKGETSPIDTSPDHEHMSIVDQRSNKTLEFQFDRVFPSSEQQDGVFDEVSDFVQSALDGYDVCLFAYGQTGSGKTFTMQGAGEGPMRGIIPRAVEKILSEAKSLESEKFEYKMTASFLEIYNEELKDLLYTKKGRNGEDTPKLAIKRNKEGRIFVENLTQINIDTKDTEEGSRQLATLMKTAMHARSVASTKMSVHSSRSHAVFILNMEGFNDDTGTLMRGSLNLCDLAGSERLDRSGTGSDKNRLRETQAINKSLSSLGAVFNALHSKASHVPYRNSKLTFLLRDCLSGDGKALMFVNLSPTVRSGGESLCSLRFAQQVSQVSFGKLTRNIEYKDKK